MFLWVYLAPKQWCQSIENQLAIFSQALSNLPSHPTQSPHITHKIRSRTPHTSSAASKKQKKQPPISRRSDSPSPRRSVPPTLTVGSSDAREMREEREMSGLRERQPGDRVGKSQGSEHRPLTLSHIHSGVPPNTLSEHAHSNTHLSCAHVTCTNTIITLLELI